MKAIGNKMRKRFVQIQNPRSKCYMLIDRDLGIIVGYSNPDRPFHRIEIISLEG